MIILKGFLFHLTNIHRIYKLNYLFRDMHIPYEFIKEKLERETKDIFNQVRSINDNFAGSSPPQVFIGSKLKYPNVNVGILSPPDKVENSWEYSAEKHWADENYSIKEVIGFRANLINSRFRTRVTAVREGGKFIDIAKEIGMAKKQVDIEIELKKKIKLSLDFEKVSLPMGPVGQLKKIELTSNPKIESKIEKVYYDTDLKAVEAIKYLYSKGFDEYKLNQLLSIGILGLKKNRRLVPTRWGITATDDTITKELIKNVRNFNLFDDHRIYFGHFMGNYYLIMFFPDIFSYELFEMYLPGSSWNPGDKIKIGTDYESYKGRKGYVEQTAGGYYANRLGVAERLAQLKKQGSCLVIRFETPEYWASLGVWVVRESTRKALANKPMIFDTKEGMLNHAKAFIKKKFNFDLGTLLKRSKLLDNLNKQPKLTQFF